MTSNSYGICCGRTANRRRPRSRCRCGEFADHSDRAPKVARSGSRVSTVCTRWRLKTNVGARRQTAQKFIIPAKTKVTVGRSFCSSMSARGTNSSMSLFPKRRDQETRSGTVSRISLPSGYPTPLIRMHPKHPRFDFSSYIILINPKKICHCVTLIFNDFRDFIFGSAKIIMVRNKFGDLILGD